MTVDERGPARTGTATGRTRDLRVMASTALVSTSCVLPSFLLGALAVELRRDLGLGASDIGIAFAVFFLAASLASAPGGRLADRGDPASVARLAALTSGLMSLAIAVLAGSLPAILGCLAVAGGANAVCQTAANLIIVRALPAHRQGLALAVKQSAIPGATLLAGLALPALALTFGWRTAFVAAACLSLASAGFLPRAGGSGGRDRRRAGGAATASGVPDVAMRTMVLLAAAACLAGTAAGSLGSFLVSAAVAARLPQTTAGLLLTASSITGIAVRLIAGHHADRRGRDHFAVVGLMLAGGAAAFALLAIGTPVTYVLVAPLAFSTAWAWPGLFNLAVVKANPSSPASATGITQTGQFVGAVAGPLGFGLIAETAGYRAAWLAAGVLAALATGALTAARRRLPRPETARSPRPSP